MAVEYAGRKRQRINAYNVLILFFVGLGSMSYGYAAAVIGITLGEQPATLHSAPRPGLTIEHRSTIIH
jgi:hypothetical protein